MATLKWVLNPRKKDDRFQLCLRVTNNRKPQLIRTIYVVDSKADFEDGKLKRSSKYSKIDLDRVNLRLSEIQKDAYSVITSYEAQNRLSLTTTPVLVDSIKKKTGRYNRSAAHTFNSFTIQKAKELKEAGRIGTAEWYLNALEMLKTNSGQKHIMFYDITYAFLSKVESKYFTKQRKSKNGLNAHLRAIRAIYNKAIKEGIIGRDTYPFTDYKLKTSKTRKRTLKNNSELDSIKNLALDPGSKEYLYRSVWLFLYYTRGMSITDAADLTILSVQEEDIFYSRNKSDSMLRIRITPAIRQIINCFSEGKNKTDYLFPIIVSENADPERKRKDVRNFTKQINKYMRRVSVKAGLNNNTTSYVSRHTFASFARNAGVSLDVIQELLGQESIRSTMKYVESFDDEKLNDAAEQVFKYKNESENSKLQLLEPAEESNNDAGSSMENWGFSVDYT